MKKCSYSLEMLVQFYRPMEEVRELADLDEKMTEMVALSKVMIYFDLVMAVQYCL